MRMTSGRFFFSHTSSVDEKRALMSSSPARKRLQRDGVVFGRVVDHLVDLDVLRVEE